MQLTHLREAELMSLSGPVTIFVKVPIWVVSSTPPLLLSGQLWTLIGTLHSVKLRWKQRRARTRALLDTEDAKPGKADITTEIIEII